MGNEVTAALVGALVAAVLTPFLTYITHVLRNRGERKRHGHYLAIRVVCALEPFVMGCAAVARDMGDWRPGDDDRPDRWDETVKEPVLILPTDVDWKAIDPQLAYRILTLPNDIAVADQNIGVTWQHDASPEEEDYFWHRRIEYGLLGLKAHSAVTSLRRIYRLPAGRESNEARRAALVESVRKAEQDRKAQRASEAASLPPNFGGA